MIRRESGLVEWMTAPAPLGDVRRTGRELIARANRVPIFDVLKDTFGIHAPRTGRSYKQYCPFAFEHHDGGMDKGFRTYPATNSAYCFVLHGWLNPVRLYELRYEIRPYAAAKKLLETYGLLQGESYRERYNSLVVEREQRVASIGEPSYLVAALHQALRDVPGYTTNQFDPAFAAAMAEQLDLLDDVLLASIPSEQAVREWFAQAKERLMETLKELAHVEA